jgi:RHS repeat-associated protein
LAHTNVDAGVLGATYDADLTGKTAGPLYFHLSDWLGTRRQQTDYAGNPVLNFTGLPYGDGLTTIPVSSTDAADATEHHFTSQVRDAESGNDYFGARYYASSIGRFMNPDSSGYSSLRNPQAWNLYAYTLNNPLIFNDPTGHVAQCTNNAADCLAAAQQAVGAKAGAMLQTTSTQSWWQKHVTGGSTTVLSLKDGAKEADFRAASGNASKLADFIDAKATYAITISDTARYEHSGIVNAFLNDSGSSLQGGSIAMLPSEGGLIPQVFLSPLEPTGGMREDEDRDHIPPANMGEKFAHEYLGHLWGEIFGGHPGGTAANKQDSVNSENEVRRTDPSRGQKTKHHD